MGKNAIRAGLFGLGFISISTQIYMLREGYIVFYGNELILGIPSPVGRTRGHTLVCHK